MSDGIGWDGIGYPILPWHQEHRSRAMLINNNDLKLKTHFLHPAKAIQTNQALSGPSICSKLCDCFELISPFAPFCTSGSKCVLLRYGQYGTTNNHGVPPYRGQCFISTPMFSRPRTPHVSWTWTQFAPANLLQRLHQRLFDHLSVILGKIFNSSIFYFYILNKS